MEENKASDISPTLDNEKEVRGGAGNGKDFVANTSGHVQEIDRTFGVVSICFMSVLTDNASIFAGQTIQSYADDSKAWGAGGGSLVVSLCASTQQVDGP